MSGHLRPDSTASCAMSLSEGRCRLLLFRASSNAETPQRRRIGSTRRRETVCLSGAVCCCCYRGGCLPPPAIVCWRCSCSSVQKIQRQSNGRRRDAPLFGSTAVPPFLLRFLRRCWIVASSLLVASCSCCCRCFQQPIWAQMGRRRAAGRGSSRLQ